MQGKYADAFASSCILMHPHFESLVDMDFTFYRSTGAYG